ncbi:MAG: hypothetical protein R3F17_07070 [Planctomycetota bacterium]
MKRAFGIPTSLFLAAGLALTACQQLPKQLGQGVMVEPGQTLDQRNPSDVVVAPVMVDNAGLAVPTQALRESLVRGLVKRRYAPLSIDFVDEAGNLGGTGFQEASYTPGTLNEEVVCQLIVHHWDQALWETRRAFEADLELRMVDPANPAGPPLWSGTMKGRYDYAEQESAYATEGAFFRAGLDQLLAEMLAVMPARETRPEAR